MFLGPPQAIETGHIDTTLIQGNIRHMSGEEVTCSSHYCISTPKPSQLVVLPANTTRLVPCASGAAGPPHQRDEFSLS